VLGAVVNIIAGSFIPLGPLVGGAISGYLQGGDRGDGLRVGALAGLIALVPIFLLFSLLWSVAFGFMMTGPGMGIPGTAGGLGFVVLVFGFMFALIYVVGLSALGGYLGNYIKQDTDVDI